MIWNHGFVLATSPEVIVWAALKILGPCDTQLAVISTPSSARLAEVSLENL